MLFVGAAWAVPAPSPCVVSEWAPWGKCVTASGCSNVRSDLHVVGTKPLPATDAWDMGRDQMTRTMKLKLESHQRAVPTSLSNPGSYACEDGKAGEMPCWNVDQGAYLSLADLGYTRLPGDLFYEGNDIWGWTDPLTGHEYAIACISGGTSFVRVTDPNNPVTLAFMYTHTHASIWRDVKVLGNYAYIVSEATSHGMQIFDLTRLRTMTELNPDVEPSAHYGLVGNAHNVVANEETNTIYIVGATMTGGGDYTTCLGGLHAVDVRDPLNPTFAGCFSEDGYTHDAQCVVYTGPDARYYNREVCFAFNEDSLTLVDTTDKAAMFMISKRTYDGVQYSHQGWLTDDMTILFLDDELDEIGQEHQYTKTYIWDVNNLEDPVLMRVHVHPNTAIDHNLYVRGELVYQANYESGLRIMYIERDDWDIREVAHFDTRPDRTTADWYGSWSVFPYFKSGTVIIQSIDYGLFVVKPDYAAIQSEIDNPSTRGTQTRQRDVHVEGEHSCPGKYDTRECAAEC